MINVIGGQIDRTGKFVYKNNLSKEHLSELNCTLLRTDIQNKIDDIAGTNEKYNYFIQQIKSVVYGFFPARDCMPRTVIKKPSRVLSPPWWNEECRSAVEERRTALKCYKQRPSIENFNHYISTKKKKCSKTLFKEKKKGWHRVCSSFNDKTPSAHVWAIAKKFRKRNLNNTNTMQDTKLILRLQNEFINKLCLSSCTPLFVSAI